MNVIPMKAPMFADNEPNENSSLDELAAYALLKQKEVLARDKMNAEDLWLMGQALQWAKNQKPHGGWEKWFKSQGLKKTYVWLARTLHKEATLDEVKELGVTEALRKFGVLTQKKAKPEAATVPDEALDEDANEPPDSNEKDTEPTDEVDGTDPAESEEDANDDSNGDEEPTDDLAEEDEKELKAFQDALRQPTPKTSAVAILHALELLREELNAEEVDEELQQTLGQIAQLAAAMKGGSKETDAEEAA